MTMVLMSCAELDRVQVLRDVMAERISAVEAAQLLHLTPRHVFRLLLAYRRRGQAGLVLQKRSKPSNRAYSAMSQKGCKRKRVTSL